ncbi:hypothetical protein FIBSPDRAFT_911970 [Athelia psychrophila]|uniref:Histone deacetylase interacting domain-containing protein n=1 Tax=Athelia psychrophila TaxID=1759441 RepID=A0A166G683_9AGAM|nr:hypothetical protein FIBSPDRAFT_911970 [Fibularhizoctonia sp. CBS 109695]
MGPPAPSKPSTPAPAAAAAERPLNVTDALSYLDAVKMQFQDQPDVYNHFLDIMKDFKSQLIDTPGVIKRVSYLFNGHPQLIQGFNTFLPVGYRIDAHQSGDGGDVITVTTPTGTMMQTGSTAGREEEVRWSMTGFGGPGPSTIGIADPAEATHPHPPVASTSANTLGPSVDSYGMPMGVGMGMIVDGQSQNQGQAIEPAVQYVQKIKQRCDAETYKQFLEILSRYHQRPESIDEREVHMQISRLFKDDPDLRSDFRIFMPEKSQSMFEEGDESMYDAPPPPERERRSARNGTPILDKTANARRGKAGEREREREREKEREAVSLPQKRKRKVEEKAPAATARGGTAAKKAKGNDSPSLAHSHARHHQREASPPHRSTHHHHRHQPPPPAPPTNDQSQFFDRVKRVLDSRETYNEFLKLVNLFTQDIIDTSRLVKESRTFLGEGELMRQWREILGWDEKRERESWLREAQEVELSAWARGPGSGVAGVVLERPGRKDLSVRYGSYRKLSSNEANVTCSGRDEMCRSVLNDEWVSHPTWSSEDSGFITQMKNVYEEALHRSEEERHEYDFHIEAIVRTISMLEPINNKIAQLPPDERGSFKLKANLGGSGKSIHQRVIKKIYGREAGMEVIQAMQDSPSLAIPVVLTRLKQKEEEWKRAQREWNKVWREVDARNYLKSLDHQGITFKAADKKAISTKSFVSQIEAARDEQMAKRASLIDPLFARTRPRHHLEFAVEDESVLQDALKLTFSFLDRTTHQIGSAERKKIESMLRGFVPTFFMLDTDKFNQAFTVIIPDNDSDASDEVSSVVDEAEASSGASGGSRNGRSHRKNGVASGGGDLRKKLLKSEQAKSTGRKTRAQEAASPSASRQGTPPTVEMMPVDVEDAASKAGDASQSRRAPRKNIFFGNTTCYVLLRLLELLYVRLYLIKSLSYDTSSAGTARSKATQSSFQSRSNKDKGQVSEHYYELMLESCERLFENDLEVQAFEDQMRCMFGIKEAYKLFTIDKLIGAIIKQVQTVLSDSKSSELLELLKKERTHGTLTTQDQINSRQNAERVIGPDENLFRIDWLSDSKSITVQLLGKDDSSFDDSEVSTGRWQAYIDSYVATETTEDLPIHRVKRPFLRKTLYPATNGDRPKIVARGALEIKVCVKTYRFFYVSNSEEVMARVLDKEEVQTAARKLEAKNKARTKWLQGFEAGSLPFMKA